MKVTREFAQFADEVRREFLNRARSLYNIDSHLLPELGDDWPTFRADSARYTINTDAQTAAAIWREVEKRQKPSVAFRAMRGE